MHHCITLSREGEIEMHIIIIDGVDRLIRMQLKIRQFVADYILLYSVHILFSRFNFNLVYAVLLCWHGLPCPPSLATIKDIRSS